MLRFVIAGKNRRNASSSTSSSERISIDYLNRTLENLKTHKHRSTTAKSYYNTWKNFNKFLIRLDKMPEKWEHRLAAYGVYLVTCGVQSATLRSYFSAIKSVLENDNYQWNDDKLLLNILSKSCRLVNDRLKIRLPIRSSLLEIVLNQLTRKFDMQHYLLTLYTAMFLIMYYGMMRIGEVASGDHAIKARDVYLADNKTKLLFVLYTSKTHGRYSTPQRIQIKGKDQEMSKMAQKYCPYQCTCDYMNIRGGYRNVNDPLFIFADGSPVKPSQVRAVLRDVIKSIHLDQSMYDTHSFRIGRAGDLMKQGYSLDTIKHLGRWKSNAVYRYLKE